MNVPPQFHRIVNALRTRSGDRIERVLNKIPGVTSLPCHDKQTGTLKPESPCGKAKARLNAGEPITPTILKRITGK
jgi:hypothetical protein